MDGIYLGGTRPKSKKEVKEAVTQMDHDRIRIEGTSAFGGYDGPLSEAPVGNYHIVGPDPYTSRKFYLTLHVGTDKVRVS
jgi:hypothetical protein